MYALAQISPRPFQLPAPQRLPDQLARTLKAHDALFFEGDEAVSIYEVVEGILRTSKVHADGRRQIPAFAYPGDLIGFGHGERYRFDCDALTPARVRSIPRHALLSAARDRPALAERLISAAADQIATMHDLSMILCRKSALQRVAAFICGLRDRTGGGDLIRLPMTRSDIADHLGLTIETVSRNITKLRQNKIIELAGPSVVRIVDARRLRRLAEEEDLIR